MSDIEFVNGLLVKPPRDGTPPFVKASLSIRRAELLAWLQARDSEWINLDVKESRNGKWYAAVNNWKPQQSAPVKSSQEQPGKADDFSDDMPF